MDAAKVTACDQDDAAACFAAADAFAPRGAYRVDGKLTAAESDRHEREAAKFAKRACDLGHGDGCVLAARFLKNGRDAVLKRGCELDKFGACGDYGWERVSAGDPAGMAYLARACRGDAIGEMGGQPGVYCDFAASVAVGRGGDKKFKDRTLAKELRVLACKQGYMDGCPCKTDADCKGTTEGVDWFCAGLRCAAPAAD
jgi:TPR repeat protein